MPSPSWPFPPDARRLRSCATWDRRSPGAVFALLVVYCLKDVDVLAGAHGIPETIGILIAGGTYLWRRNMLVSILSSTVVYMLLVNLVF